MTGSISYYKIDNENHTVTVNLDTWNNISSGGTLNIQFYINSTSPTTYTLISTEKTYTNPATIKADINNNGSEWNICSKITNNTGVNTDHVKLVFKSDSVLDSSSFSVSGAESAELGTDGQTITVIYSWGINAGASADITTNIKAGKATTIKLISGEAYVKQ